MGTVALAVALVVYNNLANRWPPFNLAWFVPANLFVCAVVLWLAFSDRMLDLSALEVWGPASPVGPGIVGLGIGLAIVAPLFLLARSTRWSRFIEDKRVEHLTGAGLLYQTLLRIPVGTALLEEVAFRGVLFGAWRPSGVVGAAVYSSIAFGLWHISPTVNLVKANRPGAGASTTIKVVLGAVVFTTAAGLGLVWLREITESLAAPLVLHSVVNALATVAAVTAHRRERPA